MPNRDDKVIAFALGGLGGSNAHGAGFLSAAQKMGVAPSIVSCTSGMIYWVSRYLQHADLEQELRAQTMQNLFPPAYNYLNWGSAMVRGVAGVCRTAVPEYWARWMKPWNPLLANEWLDRMVPAQWLIPTRSPGWFADTARIFNETRDVGVIFNVFEPGVGREYLHGNDAAMRFMKKEYEEVDEGGVVYKRITPDAVENALWLYLYGFATNKKVDGAYHRQIIMRELHRANVIFAVRPQNQLWVGDLPSNMVDMRDFEIELWFNSSYAGEVAEIGLVNKLIEQKLLAPAVDGPKKKYDHPIELISIDIGRNRGFFDYFVEDVATYQEAYAAAVSAFQKL
jgi:hypothetical protein